MRAASSELRGLGPDDEHFVRTRDGVTLATDVYIPRAQRPAPTVLVRTPYDKHATGALLPAIARRFTDAGYAVVVQDIRGRAASHGHGVPFVHEIADAADTLEWLVAQPWSDRQVACWGNSYYGFTAHAAVASGHPSVRALVSRLTSVHPSSFTHRNGVLRLGPMAEWLASTWSGPATFHPALDWSARPFADLVPNPGHRELLTSNATCLPAIGRQLRSALGRVPTLHWTGWFDLFQPAQLQDWRTATLGPNQVLIATASDHMDDTYSRYGKTPDHLLAPAAQQAMLDRTLDPVLEFLHAHLHGSIYDHAPIQWELAGAGARTDHCWPPATASPTPLYLSAHGAGVDGALTERRDNRSGSMHWEHDPDDLVPMVDTDWWRPLLTQGDAHPLTERGDVCTFTTEPTRRPIDLAGPASLQLPVRSTAPTHHIVAILCDVAPDGVSRTILQTAHRLPSEESN